MMFAFDRPEIPVDTHVYRVGGRLGLFRPNASFEEAHDEMLAVTDPDDAYELHMNLIRHGREVCRPQPRCEECGLRRMCPYWRGLRLEGPLAVDRFAAPGRPGGGTSAKEGNHGAHTVEAAAVAGDRHLGDRAVRSAWRIRLCREQHQREDDQEGLIAGQSAEKEHRDRQAGEGVDVGRRAQTRPTRTSATSAASAANATGLAGPLASGQTLIGYVASAGT